jgi:hypothetical protein
MQVLQLLLLLPLPSPPPATSLADGLINLQKL